MRGRDWPDPKHLALDPRLTRCRLGRGDSVLADPESARDGSGHVAARVARRTLVRLETGRTLCPSRWPNLNSHLSHRVSRCVDARLSANLDEQACHPTEGATCALRPSVHRSRDLGSSPPRGHCRARLVDEAGDRDEVEYRHGDSDADELGIYYWNVEKKAGGKIKCTGSCATMWPPVYVTARSRAHHRRDRDLRHRQARDEASADRERPSRLHIQRRQGRCRQCNGVNGWYVVKPM